MYVFPEVLKSFSARINKLIKQRKMFIAYETMVKNRFQTDHQEVLQHCTEFLTRNVSLSNTKSKSADHHEKVR